MFKRAPVQDVQPVTGLMSFGESASLRLLYHDTMPFTISSLFYRVTFLDHFHIFPSSCKFHLLKNVQCGQCGLLVGSVDAKVFFMKKNIEMELQLR